jgi:hypothetical protein
LSGHKHFHLSDYNVHSRSNYAFSLHCFSNRTLNTECVNGEGLQNRAIADGALFLYVTGREYTNHPPVWIWSLLPGVTSLQSGLRYTCDNAQVTAPQERTPFVGAASDGWNGAACMDFFRVDTVANVSTSLIVKKMWAFFDDGVVAVNSGIHTSDSSANATTGIEQRILDGRYVLFSYLCPSHIAASFGVTPINRVLIGLSNHSSFELDAGATLALDASQVSWLLHNGTVVVIIAASAGSILHVSTVSQNGSWSKITQGPDDPQSIPTFLAFVEHSRSVLPAFSAVALLPTSDNDHASAQNSASNFLSSISEMNYDDKVPFVCRARPNASLLWMAAGAVFQPSANSRPSVSLCPSISTTAACVFMVANHISGVITVTISNPNRELNVTAITVAIQDVQAKGQFCVPSAEGTSVTVALPTGLQSGSSSTVACDVVQ